MKWTSINNGQGTVSLLQVRVIEEWLCHVQFCTVKDGKILEYVNKDLPCTISASERATFKITVKIFLSHFNAAALQRATTKVLEHLGVEEVDSLIVAFPVLATKLTLDQVQPVWEAAELLVAKGRALAVGVSDLDSSQLKELYNWAKVKPSVNQVNLDSCCVIPQEMAEFAKVSNIQLLTHSDPKVVLDADAMERLLKDYVPDRELGKWSSSWVARYSVLVKCRGFIQSKGYIADLVRRESS
ncbi:glutamate--cysteine ligase regulatory subunit isoform X1 [Ixodes scapularis]